MIENQTLLEGRFLKNLQDKPILPKITVLRIIELLNFENDLFLENLMMEFL